MANKKSPSFAGVVYHTTLGEDFSSSTPSIMQPLSGQPVLLHTLNTTREATGNPATLILNQKFKPPSEMDFALDDLVLLPEQSNLIAVIENKIKGKTGHLLLVPGNMPLLTAAALEQLVAAHVAPKSQPVITVLYFRSSRSLHHDRIIRGDKDQIIEITDFKRESNKDLEQQEFITGAYCITANWLWGVQSQIPESADGASQLSSLVQAAISAGSTVQGCELEDPADALRIGSRIDLSKAETIMRQRTNHNLMHNGVTIIDPNATYIDAQVEVGQDTVIHPNTYLRGRTRVGEACQIGPNSMITDTEIGDRCQITFSVTESAVLEDEVDIGPFAHLRKGAHLAQGVHMGNYGEVKNSYLGARTKMGHFSYIGDANIGPDVNIGAGVITANYDGSNKHSTEIGAGAFIGSDSMLIAPLKIGAGARTGAGSVVTKDVPPNSLAVGIPARIIRKKEENDGP